MVRRRRERSMRKGTFDPEDKTRVKHSRIGVWDLYEEIAPRLGFVGWPTLQPLFDIIESLPYVWRMITDVASIRECNVLLLAYLTVELVTSLLPALSLWLVPSTPAVFIYGSHRIQVFGAASPNCEVRFPPFSMI